VDYLELTQAFVECCARNAPIDELVATFQAALERLGFRYFACCSHVDPLHPPQTAVMLHNYPDQWARMFSELRFHEVDPVLLCAEQTALPFSWDDASFRAHLTRPQKTILMEAATFGVSHGYTIPIHLPREWSSLRASCSIVPDSSSIRPPGYFAAQLMAGYLYHAASRQLGRHAACERNALTLRERQCLELAAHGKSDWVIGRVLGLSECTVHTYIERAKRRLGVVTRVQAIVEALTARQISYGDIIRAETGIHE
jgi:DNA-binding CsgD family transcriptional regulator